MKVGKIKVSEQLKQLCVHLNFICLTVTCRALPFVQSSAATVENIVVLLYILKGSLQPSYILSTPRYFCLDASNIIALAIFGNIAHHRPISWVCVVVCLCWLKLEKNNWIPQFDSLKSAFFFVAETPVLALLPRSDHDKAWWLFYVAVRLHFLVGPVYPGDETIEVNYCHAQHAVLLSLFWRFLCRN